MKFLALLFSLFPLFAFANSEYVIRTESGQDPYLIVIEDTTGASTKAPGVYGRDVSGAWRMLMPGHVVGGQTTGGVLAQLDLTHLDGRYQTIVIVDGEVRIFHLNTRPTDPKSFIRVGGPDTPAHDFFFPKRPLSLPKLSSSDDVSVVQADVDENLLPQAMLVSMRLPTPTLQGGDGVTLLLILKPAQDPQSSHLELVRDPVVIDYKFQTPGQLQRLWIRDTNHKRQIGVLSRLVMEHFGQAQDPNEPQAIQKWRAKMELFIEEFLDRGEPFNSETMLLPPYVYFETGAIKIGALPTHSQPLTSHLIVTQLYDPIEGQQGVYIGSALDKGDKGQKITPKEFTFWGKLDVDANGQYQIFSHLDPSNGQEYAALVYINEELYLVVERPEVATIRVFDSKIPKPQRLSFYIQTQEQGVGQDKQILHTVFLSAQWKNKESTSVLVVRQEPGSKTLKAIKSFGLPAKFYEEWELAARVYEANGELFFDFITPPQESERAYEQAYDETVAHTNVTRTASGNPVAGYLRAKEEIPVIPNVLEYRAFNETGGFRKETGLFLTKPEAGGKTTVEAISGGLLIPSWASKKEPFLFSEEVELSALSDKGMNDKGRLTAVAYDPSFREGAEGFSIALILTPEPFSRTKFTPIVQHLPFRFPISMLKTVLLFSGKKKSADQFTMLCTVNEPPAERAHPSLRAGVFPVSFQILKGARKDDRKDGKDEIDPLAFRVTFSERFLVQQSLLPSEILVRLMLDEAGRLYWISDPKKSKSVADYGFIRLHDGNAVLANSTEGRALTLVSLTDATKGDPRAAARFTTANWRFFGKYAAEDLSKLFDVADGSAEKEAGSVAGKSAATKKDQAVKWRTVHQRMRDFFPGLTNMIQDLSDPSKPAQHRVLLVPSGHQPLLMGYLYKLWMEEKNVQTAQHHKLLPDGFLWSADNEALKMYYLRHQVGGQDDFFANFGEMASHRPSERPVLVVDMDELSKTGRPINRLESNQEPFMISGALIEGAEQTPIPPHALYLLATEGKRIPIEQFAAMSPAELEQKVSILLIGSRNSWSALLKQAGEGVELKAGLERHFQNLVSYYHGSWRVWGPNTTLASPLIQGLVERGVARYREEVFPELEGVLREISSPAEPPRHRVLIVPNEIKEYVRNSIFARWADPSLGQNPWNHQNTNLRLFHVAQSPKEQAQAPPQDAIFDNLDIMKSLTFQEGPGSGQRPVLLGDLSAIKAINRPTGGGVEFQIQDITIEEKKGESLETTPDVSAESAYPHLLYLLATEGNKVDLKDFGAFSTGDKKVPMLLLGTQAEWDRILEDASIEKKGGLATHFEKVTLAVPDHITRKRMLAQVLARPEIRSLRYVFDPRVPGSKDPEPADQIKAQDELLAYIVSTCERLARENNMDVLTAFLKALQAFSRALVNDEVPRTRRRIDRVEIQRVLAQIFKVQLNPSLLPPNDPLVILKREDFPLLMQQAGAEGPFEWSTRVAKILLKQTEPTPKIAIPASAILFGESSSGKTRFAYSLLKVLGLEKVVYDFNKPHNPEAQAFILNCRKLIDDDGSAASNEDGEEPSGDGVMTVRQALRHLDHFLTLPNGNRGFIIIDDAHAPKDSIRAKIIAKIQSLVGSEDGMWRGRSELVDGSPPVEVPLQNVTLLVIANPTYDQKRIEQFKKDKWSAPTLEELLLASLTTDEQKLDPSFLRRFSAVLRMDTFASEARAPAVLGDVRKGAHQIFSSQNRLILVSPESVEHLCARFPVDARTLLSQVPQALLSTADISSPTPVHIIVPRVTAVPSAPEETSGFVGVGKVSARPDPNSPYDERAIEAYVQTSIQGLPVTKDNFEGRVELLKYLLTGFRIHVFELLIKSVSRDPRFATDPIAQQRTLAPLLHAIKAHLELNPGVRLEDLVLNPRDFGVVNTALEADFRRAVTVHDTLKRGFWPKWIFAPTRTADLMELTLGEKRFATRDRSRRDVLVETSRMLEGVLREFMGEYYQVGSLDAKPSASIWLQNMTPPSLDVLESIGKRLGTEFLDFLMHLHEENLMEVRGPETYELITPYDAARFYLLTLDRAISRLPWGGITQFMTSSLEVAAQEMSLGERPNVQAMLFEHRDSFLAARTPELPIQMVVNTSVFKEWRGEPTDTTKEDRMAKRILDECERMLAKPDAS